MKTFRCTVTVVVTNIEDPDETLSETSPEFIVESEDAQSAMRLADDFIEQELESF